MINSIYEVYPFFWVKQGKYEEKNTNNFCLLLFNSDIYFLKLTIFMMILLNISKVLLIIISMFSRIYLPVTIKPSEISQYELIKSFRKENFLLVENSLVLSGLELVKQLTLKKGNIELKEQNKFFILKSRKYNFESIIKKFQYPDNENIEDSISNFFRSLKLTVCIYF